MLLWRWKYVRYYILNILPFCMIWEDFRKLMEKWKESRSFFWCKMFLKSMYSFFLIYIFWELLKNALTRTCQWHGIKVTGSHVASQLCSLSPDLTTWKPHLAHVSSQNSEWKEKWRRDRCDRPSRWGHFPHVLSLSVSFSIECTHTL